MQYKCYILVIVAREPSSSVQHASALVPKATRFRVIVQRTERLHLGAQSGSCTSKQRNCDLHTEPCIRLRPETTPCRPQLLSVWVSPPGTLPQRCHSSLRACYGKKALGNAERLSRSFPNVLHPALWRKRSALPMFLMRSSVASMCLEVLHERTQRCRVKIVRESCEAVRLFLHFAVFIYFN